VWNAVTDELWSYTDGAEVVVTHVDTEVDTVRRGNNVVASVVGTEAARSELHTNNLEGLEHVRPVLGIAEPELGFFFLALAVLEYQVIGVELLPSLSTLRGLE
jgi:hypothetical protein